jgi:chromosome segregation ATPase
MQNIKILKVIPVLYILLFHNSIISQSQDCEELYKLNRVKDETINQLYDEIEKLELEISSKKAEISNLKDKTQSNRTGETIIENDCQDEIDRLQKELNRLINSKAKFQSEINTLNNEIKRITNSYNTLRNTYIADTTSLNATIRAKNKLISNKIKYIKKLKADSTELHDSLIQVIALKDSCISKSELLKEKISKYSLEIVVNQKSGLNSIIPYRKRKVENLKIDMQNSCMIKARKVVCFKVSWDSKLDEEESKSVTLQLDRVGKKVESDLSENQNITLINQRTKNENLVPTQNKPNLFKKNDNIFVIQKSSNRQKLKKGIYVITVVAVSEDITIPIKFSLN